MLLLRRIIKQGIVFIYNLIIVALLINTTGDDWNSNMPSLRSFVGRLMGVSDDLNVDTITILMIQAAISTA